jgi:hypothetical protein
LPISNRIANGSSRNQRSTFRRSCTIVLEVVMTLVFAE